MGQPSIIPPTREPVFFDNIPEHVQKLNHWVLWNWEKNDKDKWTKPLYCASDPGRHASSADPKTWASFADARKAYEANRCHGVGIVVSNLPNAFDDLVAIDLDAVFDPHSKKITDSFALRIHELANSYTEVSPSGIGIRILGQVDSVLKALPGHKHGVPGSKNLGYEIYFHHRYVTITGRTLALYTHPLRKMTDEARKIYGMIGDLMVMREIKRGPADYGLSNLSDDAILEKIRHSAQGNKFNTLWLGNWQTLPDCPSQSEADLKLCMMLAFWTNRDPDTIDRIFRQSALMRDKWEREDYRTKTISIACAGTENVYQHPQPVIVVKEEKPFVRPAEWQRVDAASYPWNFKKPTVIVNGVMNDSGVTFIAAQSQAGKSLLTTNMVMCMARGGLLFNKLEVVPLFPIWYLVLEDPGYRVEQRFGEMLAEYESIPEGRLIWDITPGFSLGEQKMLDYMAAEVKTKGIKCVVVDTFQASTAGITSFDDERLGVILNDLRIQSRILQVQIIVIDHLRKKSGQGFTKNRKVDLDDIKGSGVKVQNSDTVIFLERESQSMMRFHVRSKDHGALNYLLSVSPIGSSEPKFTFFRDLDTKDDRAVFLKSLTSKMADEHWYSRTELEILWEKTKQTVNRYVAELQRSVLIRSRAKTAKVMEFKKLSLGELVEVTKMQESSETSPAHSTGALPFDE